MKETFYFSHDYNARTDDKVKKLTRKYWMEWYWLYWAIIEDLYNNANALQLDYEGIAFDYRVDENLVKGLIEDFGLFVIKNDEFYSKSVQDRLDQRTEKSRKARESAEKRWGVKNANAYQSQSKPNALKERKGKENKIKKDFFAKITDKTLYNKIDKELGYYLEKFPSKEITLRLLEDMKDSLSK